MKHLTLINDIFQSSLIERDNRLVIIANDLISSAIKIHSAKNSAKKSLAKTNAEKLKNMDVKKLLTDLVYRSVLKILENKIKLDVQYNKKSKQYTPAGLSQKMVSDPNQSEDTVDLYVALYIAIALKNNLEIKKNIFGEKNSFFESANFKTNKSKTLGEDILDATKALGNKTSIKNLINTKTDAIAQNTILSDLQEINNYLISTKKVEPVKADPKKVKPEPTESVKPVGDIAGGVKESDTLAKKQEFYNGFENGISMAKLFLKDKYPNIQCDFNEINEIFKKIFNELQQIYLSGKIQMSYDKLPAFIKSCYLATIFKICHYDEQQFKINIEEMNNLIAEWVEIKCLKFLTSGDYETSMNKENAKVIFKGLYSQLIDNIQQGINSLSSENKAKLLQFFNDVKNGILANPYSLKIKYNIEPNLAHYGHASNMIEDLSKTNPQMAINLIMERIGGYTYFIQHAEMPQGTTPMQKDQDVKELLGIKNVENKKQVQTQSSVWVNEETIKLVSAILYQLYKIINQ